MLTKKPVIKQIVTDANGNYSFTNLNPGCYVISEKLQPKWVPTTIPGILISLKTNERIEVNVGNRMI
jgi:protocatechuate 3,4-dioxygenase beta subunit